MGIERPDVFRGYPPLPQNGKGTNDPDRPSPVNRLPVQTGASTPARPSVSAPGITDAPTSEVGQQLQELIPELRSLTREMRALREERRRQDSSKPAGTVVVTEPGAEGKAVARRATSTDIPVVGRPLRRRSSPLKGVFLAFVVAGAVASILAAMVLLFYGPAIL